MLGTFRKHSTWLWVIIIAAMAVSLIVWTGNRGSHNDGGGRADLGAINGKRVTPDDYRNARAEVRLEYYFSRGEWPENSTQRDNFDLNAETYKRLFLIQKEDELGIHVGSDVVARVAALNLQQFAKKAGGITMADFEKTVLKSGGLDIADFERFLRHSLGVRQLVAAVGVSGQLVTAQEAKSIYERENQDFSAQIAFFNFSNYLASVSVTPAALSEFYSNQIVHYRVPDRVQVSYVEFKATNYWAEAGADMAKMTNQAGMAELSRKYGLPANIASLSGLNDLVEGMYNQRGGTNYYTDTTPEKAKEGIREELRHQFAMMSARNQAAKFADPILSQKVIKAEALNTEASKEGRGVKVSAPFAKTEAPAELGGSENLAKAAFALRDDEPIAGPLIGKDAVYIIARNKEIPSAIPAFDTVKDRVEQDYKATQALQAARIAAVTFTKSATNGLAQGKAFASLCADAKVKSELLPPFSLSTRSLPEVEDYISLQQFKQVVTGTPPGHVSPAVPVMEGSVVVFVQSKLAIDEKKEAADLPDFIKLLRQARESEAFQEWFSREASQALSGIASLRRGPAELNPN
jgi:hypothetical protein